MDLHILNTGTCIKEDIRPSIHVHNDILVNWKAYMESGPIKLKRFVLWSPPLLGVLKFNIDGAARGKLGPAGIRGVFCNKEGDFITIWVFVIQMKRKF